MTCMLPLERLVPHPANVRHGIGDVTDLASSIRSVGILQPLVVIEAPAKRGTYVVVAGHRRLAAARLLGLREVPCVIRTDADGINDQTVIMLVENLQRTDLGPVEKAEAFGELQRRGLSVAAIAARVGLSESQVRKTLALLELAPQSLEAVREGRIEVGRALDAVKDARAAQRTSSYRRPTDGPIAPRPKARTVVEPAHFSESHPLAPLWRARCRRYDHGARPRIAKACHECIEAVIRADERSAIADTSSTTEGIPA